MIALPARVVTREAWGCPDGAASPGWAPAVLRPTHVIVHHTAIPVPEAAGAEAVRHVWRLHAVERGWGDIGYHYLIGPDGAIYEGRAGGSGVVGGHFIGGNQQTVGVALLGDFMSAPVGPRASAALVALVGRLCAVHGIDPDGPPCEVFPGCRLRPVCGHRDGKPSTRCPGDRLYARLDEVRTGAAAAMRGRL